MYGWHEVLERLAVEADGGLVVATLVPLHCFTDQVRLQTSSAVVVIRDQQTHCDDIARTKIAVRDIVLCDYVPAHSAQNNHDGTNIPALVFRLSYRFVDSIVDGYTNLQLC